MSCSLDSIQNYDDSDEGKIEETLQKIVNKLTSSLELLEIDQDQFDKFKNLF